MQTHADDGLREADVVRRLEAARVLPVVTLDDADRAKPVAEALVRGGLPCIEIAFRSPAAAEALRQARLQEGLLVGAGTILTTEQATAAADAGAQFAVAPGTNEDVVACCRELGLPFFPGVATPSEIERARSMGLRTLKLFPASTVGGVNFLRAVSATYPDVRFIPTGGITPQTLHEYLAVPSVLAVGGSWLVKDAKRPDDVERLAREAVELAG
jgi:2-dehydro-3-deoxyphosphogluconate aldolase/(4S)-4-hydroxy-2-oxoglutarate aldolase